MKKKIEVILSIVGLIALCLGVSACAKKTKVEEYEAQGYKISVTYDANGGAFLGRENVAIMDMFNPSKYPQDGDGKIRIKLTEPTDASRPTSGSETISLTKSEYFFAGWYQTRTPLTNEDGKVVDKNGAELKEINGSYVYADDEEKSAIPAYTYSDYWDFEKDVIEYSEKDGAVSLTLYAGWVPYYEFNYYYQKEGEWTLYGTTHFDYKTVHAENSLTSDYDTIWVPAWGDCAMDYTHKYANDSNFTFPKLDGTTFSKAYLDKECTQEIKSSFRHRGTLDLEKGTAVNRVENIYVRLEEGERYKISNAKQLCDNPNINGYYEIFADLDFTGLSWPSVFTSSKFGGRIYGTENNRYSLKNIDAKYAHTTAKSGGLFGSISKSAVIKNISFENVTLDLVSMGARLQDTSFGLFAGLIEEGAAISDVAVDGTLKIGVITPGANCSVNLLANGNRSGITANDLHLRIYGQKLINDYNYTVKPETVTIDEDNDVSLTFVTSYRSPQAFYDIK